jgi:hypothetical protein
VRLANGLVIFANGLVRLTSGLCEDDIVSASSSVSSEVNDGDEGLYFLSPEFSPRITLTGTGVYIISSLLLLVLA